MGEYYWRLNNINTGYNYNPQFSAGTTLNTNGYNTPMIYNYSKGVASTPYNSYMNSTFSYYNNINSAPKTEAQNIYDSWGKFLADYNPSTTGKKTSVQTPYATIDKSYSDDTENNHSAIDTDDALNEEVKEELCEYVDENAKEEQKEQAGSFGGAAATAVGSAVVGIPLLQPGLAKPVLQNSEVREVTNMFYKDAQKKAKNDLFKKYPDLMTEAQDSMNKLNKRFAKILKKSPSNATAISNNLSKLNKIMDDAIKSGNPDKIAQANAKIQQALSANGNWFKRIFRGQSGKTQTDAMLKAANKANVSTIKASTEKQLSKTLGHSVKGAGAMAIVSTLLDVVPKLCRGEKVNWTETLTKAGLTSVAFTAAEAGTKFVVKKSLGKIAGKLAGKLAGKCAGKAIGAAIGSVVPGIGTAIGFVVGCIADWAIGKWVIPAIFPPDTSEQKAKVKEMDSEELLITTTALAMEGKKTGKASKELMERNPELTNAIVTDFEAKLQKEQKKAA